MNIFKSVKEAVSVMDAASFYGIKVNRSGLCNCPFHNDKTPSMKVDIRYYCFPRIYKMNFWLYKTNTLRRIQ